MNTQIITKRLKFKRDKFKNSAERAGYSHTNRTKLSNTIKACSFNSWENNIFANLTDTIDIFSCMKSNISLAIAYRQDLKNRASSEFALFIVEDCVQGILYSMPKSESQTAELLEKFNDITFSSAEEFFNGFKDHFMSELIDEKLMFENSGSEIIDNLMGIREFELNILNTRKQNKSLKRSRKTVVKAITSEQEHLDYRKAKMDLEIAKNALIEAEKKLDKKAKKMGITGKVESIDRKIAVGNEAVCNYEEAIEQGNIKIGNLIFRSENPSLLADFKEDSFT